MTFSGLPADQAAEGAQRPPKHRRERAEAAKRWEPPRGADGQGGPGLTDKLETQRRAAHGPERVAATGRAEASGPGRVQAHKVA